MDLLAHLQHLATFNAGDPPAAGDTTAAVTRVVFTEPDLAARAWLVGLCEDAGLAVRVDAVGNTFARWCPDGCDADAPAVATGSHCDAIPHSGMYDGTVGVLGGLAAICQLQADGVKPARPVELIGFTSEEPTRFGLGCTGSRVMAGLLDDADLDRLRDQWGDRGELAERGAIGRRTFNDVRRDAGFTGAAAEAHLPAGHYDAFVELHTEQGPLLEAAGVDIGAVTAIAAPAAFELSLIGASGHAGAQLMPDRRDALAGAAEAVIDIERTVLAANADRPSPDLVGTVGKLHVHPGNTNAVPGRVDFTLDLRDTDLAHRDAAEATIRQGLADLAHRRGLELVIDRVNADPPAPCADRIVAAVTSAAESAGLTALRMISRAYHDSTFMSRICPIGMIFIPCRAGVSHRPDEFASEAALRNGVEVLARTLRALSS